MFKELIGYNCIYPNEFSGIKSINGYAFTFFRNICILNGILKNYCNGTCSNIMFNYHMFLPWNLFSKWKVARFYILISALNTHFNVSFLLLTEWNGYNCIYHYQFSGLNINKLLCITLFRNTYLSNCNMLRVWIITV